MKLLVIEIHFFPSAARLGTYDVAELSGTTSVNHHNTFAATVDEIIGSLTLLVLNIRDSGGESTGNEGKKGEELHIDCLKRRIDRCGVEKRSAGVVVLRTIELMKN